ncbi:MAG: FKBP-type peptidyl-prolyl cis-trans isomerase [Myxococcaceae bacterium]|nr:FKBP-type peptidyl-prolyl cis-trans isomerase [Myxococcaceae bacterium]
MSRIALAAALTFASLALAADPAKAPPPGGAPGGAPGMMGAPPPAAPLTADDRKKALYAVGASIGKSLGNDFAPSADELKEIIKGLTDAATGKKLALTPEEYFPKVQQMIKDRREVRGAEEKKKGQDFLTKAAAEKGAEKTASGLIYSATKVGTGAQPTAADTVKVHYRGTLIDGTEFDSSYKRNAPIDFPLGNVIKCWTEGVAKMKVGGKAKLVCPSDIAYGPNGSPPVIPPNATLVFEVELLDVVAAKK